MQEEIVKEMVQTYVKDYEEAMISIEFLAQVRSVGSCIGLSIGGCREHGAIWGFRNDRAAFKKSKTIPRL